ncbi:Transcriptional regulator, Fis family [Candidatus Filomicrobium marinum]|uniref:Transcriptional regulator, Fis family n=2 Tax=Filomicrobium TaxID=119044 RepID=A0A0D6JDW1_9HYPH|nr:MULTISPECIES: efflux RND transporter periplasmic adaptor subunit [Filomicrobium]CFX17896.1 Transcriptional regulator, Fis family [Candidatus Filomicrobium marinum]CPR18301.1 Transcriptional regulator, Fis family [Candidatus Filomicrobium marinum]SDO20985.1 membrane fusion protein, Cu(I)/Ag(I) efflux system [Filomicrobium insigne]
MKYHRLVIAAFLVMLLPLSSGLPTYATETPGSQPSDAKKGDVKWTCPMHPHYIASEFGACPICGMDLVKLESDGAAEAASEGQQRTAIVVAPETLQTMGVRIAKAEQTSFGRIVRSFGRISENERLQTEMSARTEAWIEDLRIRAIGDAVRKGDLLFTLYAPEFIVSQRDYLEALSGQSRTRIQSVETRLKAFGMQKRTIAELRHSREVMEFVPFYADRDGTVTMIDLRPGSYVKRGTILTRIQDYSQVWLMVSVSEKDLSFIEPGIPARVTFPNIPGREVFAKVEYVYPTIDPATRTGQVRLVLDNKDGQLRPGAYADVAFEVGTEQRLAVPSEAILKSGGARYVVASLGGGRFEPRTVTTGLISGRWTEIGGEIEAGDDIVVSGQFLIDSESALRESFRKLERLQLPLSLLKLDSAQFAMVDHFVDAALYLHETLTDGYQVEPKFLDPAIEVKTLLWPAFQHTRLAFVMEDAVKAIRDAQAAKTDSEVKAALATLVDAVAPWIREGAPDHYREKKIALWKDDGSARMWLQLEGRELNPYGKGSSSMISYSQPAPEEGAASANAAAEEMPSTKPKTMPGHQH